MKMSGWSVATFAHQANAAVIATMLVCGVASAQEANFRNFADLPQNVKDAFGTIEQYLQEQNLGQEIAIVDFATIDRSSGAPEPGRTIVIDSRRASEAEQGSKKVGVSVDQLDVSSELTILFTASPGCVLQLRGGRYYWYPDPPCPE